jgi:predicted CopG family antitoxin
LKKSYGKFLQEVPEDEIESKSFVELLARYFDLRKEELINVVGSIMRDKNFFSMTSTLTILMMI